MDSTSSHHSRVAQIAQAIPLETINAVSASSVECKHRGYLTSPLIEIRFDFGVVIQNSNDLLDRIAAFSMRSLACYSLAGQIIGNHVWKEVDQMLALCAHDVAKHLVTFNLLIWIFSAQEIFSS